MSQTGFIHTTEDGLKIKISEIYVKLVDPLTPFVEPDTYAELISLVSGTTAKMGFKLGTTLTGLVGKYFLFYTPVSTHVMWFGLAADATPPSGLPSDWKKHKVVLPSATPQKSEIMAAILAATKCKDMVVVDGGSDTALFTAMTGGACPIGSIGTVPTEAMSIATSPVATAGTGEWAKIGPFMESIDEGGDAQTEKLADGSSLETSISKTAKFNWIAVNEQNIKQAKLWRKKNVTWLAIGQGDPTKIPVIGHKDTVINIGDPMNFAGNLRYMEVSFAKDEPSGSDKLINKDYPLS